MEFWGVEMKSGEPLKVSPGDKKMLHLSQANIGEPKKKKGNKSVCLYLTIDGKKRVIGTLYTNKLPQQQLDLVFQRDFELSHNWKNGSVFFYGYKKANNDGKQESKAKKQKSAEVAAKQKVLTSKLGSSSDDFEAETSKKRQVEASSKPKKKAKATAQSAGDGGARRFRAGRGGAGRGMADILSGNRLPMHIWEEIWGLLAFRDGLKCSRVCRAWRAILLPKLRTRIGYIPYIANQIVEPMMAVDPVGHHTLQDELTLRIHDESLTYSFADACHLVAPLGWPEKHLPKDLLELNHWCYDSVLREICPPVVDLWNCTAREIQNFLCGV